MSVKTVPVCSVSQCRMAQSVLRCLKERDGTKLKGVMECQRRWGARCPNLSGYAAVAQWYLWIWVLVTCVSGRGRWTPIRTL